MSGWVCVNKKKPRIGRNVLLWTVSGRLEVGWRNQHGAWVCGENTFAYYVVAYWMPIPRPPKKAPR